MTQIRKEAAGAIRSLGALTALSILVAGCAGGDVEPALEGEVQAFTNAHIFDGTGDSLLENGVVLVRDGLIAEVGAADAVTVPEGAEVIDLGGRYLMPGMINAHAHLDTATAAENLPIPVVEQVEIYGYYGVTTLLSLGEANAAALNMRADRFDPELTHARIFAAGQIYTPMTADSAVAAVNRLAEQQVDWVKIRVDNFLGTREKMPPEAYQAVIETAQSHSIPVAVHFVELADGKGVVQAGASLLAHSVRDVPVDQEFIDLLLANDVCLVPTLTRELSTFVLADRPAWFDDPFFLERAAPENIDTYITPELQEAHRNSAGAVYYREHLPVAEENLVALHAAGVGIAAGTDTGTGFPARFQGYLEHVELQMMVDAGLTPADALVSATGRAASCIGLEGVVGTITPGAWADFVALDANPVEDIMNTRTISGVWVAGNQIR